LPKQEPPIDVKAQVEQNQQDSDLVGRGRSHKIFERPESLAMPVTRPRSNALFERENPFKLQSDIPWRNAMSPHTELKDVLKNRKKNQRKPGDPAELADKASAPQTFSDLFAAQEQQPPAFKLQSDITWRNAMTPHKDVKELLKNRKKNQRKPSEQQGIGDGEIKGRGRAGANADLHPVDNPFKLQSDIRVGNFLTPHKEVRDIIKNRNKAQKQGHAPRGESTGARLKSSFKLGFEKAAGLTNDFVERGKEFAKSLADKFNSDGGGHGFSFFKNLLKKQATEQSVLAVQPLGGDLASTPKFSAEIVNPINFSAKVPIQSTFLKVPTPNPIKLMMPGDMSGSKAFNPAPKVPNPFKAGLKEA
jgi:hypothetical protein